MVIPQSSLKPDVVTDLRCLLGEGPVWNAEEGMICWIDILKGEIHQYNPEDDFLKTVAVNQMIGSIALTTDGNFIGGLKEGIGLIDKESGEVKIVASPEDYLSGNRFNDGKCDPQGRFWAGTVSLTEERGAGSVYVLERDFRTERKITGVTIANGMAWSPDHQTFYFIDTPTQEVVSYRFHPDGDIDNKNVVVRISPEDGFPDGMTIDSEGMLWIAHWDGWQVTRWNPANGEKLCSIYLPVANVTSCVFGGKKLNDLYITTARKGLTNDDLEQQPLAGSLFVIRDCAFQGTTATKFTQ